MSEGKLLGRGPIQKMLVNGTAPVHYTLPIGDDQVDMSAQIGRSIRLEWHREILCTHCGRRTNKSFNQGYCYPCFTTLAQCDRCVVSPEHCHYDKGTCREPEWGEAHCLIPHTVYLSNASGLKVGITRGLNPTTRWIDQGASQAVAIRVVPDRRSAGDLEVLLKDHVADKTNWRKMLKGEPERLDLLSESKRLMAALCETTDVNDIPGDPVSGSAPLDIEYPVRDYPEKVSSHNLDKNPLLEGKLVGIKGQYLIYEHTVINVRKYGGYVISVFAD